MKRFLFLIGLLFITLSLFAHPDIEPLFTPDDFLEEKRELSSTSVLTADEVFRLSLLFSECKLESETAARCLAKFEKIKTEVTSPDFMNQSPEERGRAILKLLYRDYLRTYDFDQTKTDVALETGVYNCVSSALIYMAAAKASGLEVRGQRTTQHAFCSVYVPVENSQQLQKIDVETTNPYGFNPGSRETIENEANIKKYYIVPKKYYSNRQEISDCNLAGLIAGNICSTCIKKKDYARGIPLGATRYEMVRQENTNFTANVRQDFDVLIANYVNILPPTAEKFSEVLDWFTTVLGRWGVTDFLQKNMDNAYNNLIILCLKEKNNVLAEEYFQKYQNYVTKNQQRKTEQLYKETVWLYQLNDYMTSKDYQSGLQKAEEALKELPDNQKIKNMRTNFYNNCISVIHNRFAKEANAGHFDAALQILTEGLQDFPEDRILKKDLADLKKVMQ